MKRLPTRLIASMLLLAAPAAAQDRPDPIDRVVVYSDRAQVTRRMTVQCREGDARARFGPLPAVLVERTLRGDATGGATAVGVVARRIEHGPERDARLAPLHAELERLDRAAEALDRRGERHAAAQAQVVAFAELLVQIVRRDARATKPPTERWASALDGLRTAAFEAVDALTALALERARLERERALVQARFDALAGSQAAEAFEVEVAVDCAKAAQAEVRLSYVVPGATWRPEYDLRFAARTGETGPGTVTLGLGAAVQQATGEDWQNATLVLSSARPWLGVEAPTPAPMHIGAHATAKGKVLVQAQERRRRLERDGQAAPTAGPAGAALDDKGQSVTWTLPHRVDVQSDGRPYWVPIDRLTAPGEAKNVAVPQRTAHVYRLVSFDNPARGPLLAGRLHTWRGDSFVGTQQIEHTGPGAPLEVSLGIDEALRIERVVLDDRTRDPGFLSSTRRLPRAFAITVRSTAARPAQVEVRENIPVSKAAVVKVAIDDKQTTAGHAFDALTGLVTFGVTVSPGGQETVKLGYSITLPDDWKM